MNYYDKRTDVRQVVEAALLKEAKKRYLTDGLQWIANERIAMVDAANLWQARNGIGQPVNLDMVEAVESRACGHVDYVQKMALYVSELVLP